MTCPRFVSLDEVEALARGCLPQQAYDYYAGASETQQAAKDNRDCFSALRIIPRCLVDVSRTDTSCTLLGYSAAMPVLVAPMAMHGLAHASKEPGTARGAAAARVPMCLSTMANSSPAEVAQQSGHECLLFQLYVLRDRQLVEALVRQAEAAGYKALVVTVDAQRLGKREADERNRFALPQHLQLANLLPLAAKRQAQAERDMLQMRAGSQGSGLFELFAKEVDDSLTWSCLAWLRSITRLPVWVKGVMCAEDARLALQHGAAGIIVSNHGGRQLDYSPAALDVLPDVVAAVGGRLPVWMDGGVRRGTDILKALALGAQAVMLGRPVLYALAVGGPDGVQRVLELLRAELELAMALAGATTVSQIGPHMLLHKQGTRLAPVAPARSRL